MAMTMRGRWTWMLLACVALIGVIWLMVSDRWDERGIAEVVALGDQHAVTIESTYSNSEWERELTISRIDSRGERMWRTILMSGGGNIGDLLSEDPDPGTLLLRLHRKDGVELVALAATDGGLRWSERLAKDNYLIASAVTVGLDLWIDDGSRLELRDAASGDIRWRADDVHEVIVADGAAFTRNMRFSHDGARSVFDQLSWTSFGRPCVVGDFVLGMRPFFPGLSAGQTMTVHAGRADGEPERWEIQIDERWRDSSLIELGGMLCGRSTTTDVITVEYGRNGRQVDLVGLDRTSHEPRWTLSYGGDQGAPQHKDFARTRDLGTLPRFVAVIIEVDNHIDLDWAVREGESEFDASTRAVREFRERGGHRHAYRLDLLDLEHGRVVWTLPLARAAEYPPQIFRTECCQVVFATDLARIVVISSATGEIVKAVRYTGDGHVKERQLAGDMLWLIARDYRAAHGYRLPELTSADPKAPGFADATAGVRALVERK